MIYTGYEIVPFGRNVSLYGFSYLEEAGYIASIPTVAEWDELTSEEKRAWLVSTNERLNLALSNGA